MWRLLHHLMHVRACACMCVCVCVFVGLLILSTVGKVVHGYKGSGILFLSFSPFPPSLPSFLPSSLPSLLPSSFPFLAGGGFPKVTVPLGSHEGRARRVLAPGQYSLLVAGTPPALCLQGCDSVWVLQWEASDQQLSLWHQLASIRALWGLGQGIPLQLHPQHP